MSYFFCAGIVVRLLQKKMSLVRIMLIGSVLTWAGLIASAFTTTIVGLSLTYGAIHGEYMHHLRLQEIQLFFFSGSSYLLRANRQNCDVLKVRAKRQCRMLYHQKHRWQATSKIRAMYNEKTDLKAIKVLCLMTQRRRGSYRSYKCPRVRDNEKCVNTACFKVIS